MENPNRKSEMLPYTGGKFLTFRAYVGDQFKDTDLDVYSVVARHCEELNTNIHLIDFSSEVCIFTIGNLSLLTGKQRQNITRHGTYIGNYAFPVADFINTFFAQEVENAILLDLEQEFRLELGEKGEVEAEDRNDYFNCL